MKTVTDKGAYEARLEVAIEVADGAAEAAGNCVSKEKDRQLCTGKPYQKYCRQYCKRKTWHWYSYTMREVAVTDAILKVGGARAKIVDRSTDCDVYACSECGLTRLELRVIPGEGETIGYDKDLGVFVLLPSAGQEDASDLAIVREVREWE